MDAMAPAMLHGAIVFCIVPARNEARRIARVVRTMPPFVDDILVIDDASTDGTAHEAAAPGDPRVKLLRHPQRRGVGGAIVTGYKHALRATAAMGRDERAVFAVMAGDGQMDPRDLRRVATPVALGEADYVKGNRFEEPAVDMAMPLGRRIGGRTFSLLTSLAVGQRISDSQCGYTALAREACDALPLDDLYCGYGYPNDMLGQLARRHARIHEVPVRAVYAGEQSGLGLRHLPRIGYLVAKAMVTSRGVAKA